MRALHVRVLPPRIVIVGCRYMAPELGDGEPLSVTTDVFSFGMTSWQARASAVMRLMRPRLT